MADRVEENQEGEGSSSTSYKDEDAKDEDAKWEPLREVSNTLTPMKKVRCYQSKNGWHHCRKLVPIKPKTSVGTHKSRTAMASAVRNTITHSEDYKNSIKHLYHKDKRFTCPDCEAWYAGDQRKLQLTCRHRQRYETPEELKMWDIGFPEDYDYATISR